MLHFLILRKVREVIGFWRDLIDQGIVHAYNHTEQDKATTDVQNLNTAIWFGSYRKLKDNLAIADELDLNWAQHIFQRHWNMVHLSGCCVVMMSNISDKEKGSSVGIHEIYDRNRTGNQVFH